MTNTKDRITTKTLSEAEKNKPALTKNDKRKFAIEYVNTNRNSTAAYQKIRPLVKDRSASVRGNEMLKDVIVQAEIQALLDEIGITKRYILEGFKTAIDSGLAKKATNRDAISALKEVARISGISENTENEASERLHLESQSDDDLLTRLDQIQNQIKDLKTFNAVEGELIDNK